MEAERVHTLMDPTSRPPLTLPISSRARSEHEPIKGPEPLKSGKEGLAKSEDPQSLPQWRTWVQSGGAQCSLRVYDCPFVLPHALQCEAIHSLLPLFLTSFPSQKETPPAQCISPRQSFSSAPTEQRRRAYLQVFRLAGSSLNSQPKSDAGEVTRRFDHSSTQVRQHCQKPPPGRSRPGHARGHGETSYRVIAIQTRQTSNGQSKEQPSLDRPPSAAFRSRKLHEKNRERLGRQGRVATDRNSDHRHHHAGYTLYVPYQPFLSLDSLFFEPSSPFKRPPHTK